MSYLTKVGSFNIDPSKTVTETQSITGIGFQPKIVLFFWSGGTNTEDEVVGGTIHSGFGAGIDSTHRYNHFFTSGDGLAASYSYALSRNTDVICVYTEAGTIEGSMDLSSVDTDGFTLTVDDQFVNAYKISYMALGGTDLTNVYTGSLATPIVQENYSITNVGFQPDALIISYGGAGPLMMQLTIGMATGLNNQSLVVGGTLANAITTTAKGYCHNNEIHAHITGTDVDIIDSFVSFDENGFTLNHLEGSPSKTLYFIALKGGLYSVGSLTTHTDENDIAETVGFQPSAILFASANRTLDTQGVLSSHNKLSIGAATSTSNRTCIAVSDEDNLADSETAHANYDSAVYAHVVDDAIVGLMDLKSIDSDGFTCVMDDTDPSECWVTYLAIGASTIEGSTSWGHTSESQEGNARTFSGNWTGTGFASGSGNYEKMYLSSTAYMESEVVNTGINSINLYQNRYSGGDTGILKYRSGSTVVNCQSGEWQTYSGSFTSLGYTQVRVEGS